MTCECGIHIGMNTSISPDELAQRARRLSPLRIPVGYHARLSEITSQALSVTKPNSCFLKLDVVSNWKAELVADLRDSQNYPDRYLVQDTLLVTARCLPHDSTTISQGSINSFHVVAGTQQVECRYWELVPITIVWSDTTWGCSIAWGHERHVCRLNQESGNANGTQCGPYVCGTSKTMQIDGHSVEREHHDAKDPQHCGRSRSGGQGNVAPADET